MRVYFRHARAIDRLTVLLDEVPLAKSLWTRRVWQTQIALSSAEFKVVDGRVSLRQAASIEDPAVLFRLFELVCPAQCEVDRRDGKCGGGDASRYPKMGGDHFQSLDYLRQIPGACLMPHPHCARCTSRTPRGVVQGISSD